MLTPDASVIGAPGIAHGSEPHPELPRSERAYAHLRDLIATSRLAPGTRLRELDLAASFGLSRTPVRAALARLEAEGLVANDPVKGMVVTELDHGMVAELYVMRDVLEGTAARLAARHASDVEIAVLREIALHDRDLQGDAEALTANNRRFHNHLYRCAHNRYLLKTVSAVQEALVLLGRTTLSVTARAKVSGTEHLAIVAALEARDEAKAETLVRQHIQAAYRTRLTMMVDEEAPRRRGVHAPSPAIPATVAERAAAPRAPRKPGGATRKPVTRSRAART